MRKFLLIAIVLPILLGFVSIPLVMPIAKSIRSQQHLRNAIQLSEQGMHREALTRILAARNLAPENPEVLKRVGPYAAAVRDPGTLKWWTEAANMDVLDLDGILDMIDYGLSINQADQVQSYLYEVYREHPDDLRVQSLQIRLLRSQQRNQETFAIARDLVQEGKLNREILSSYVQGLLSVEEVPEQERMQVLATLRNSAEKEGDIGIFSLRAMLRLWDQLESVDKEILEQKLDLHPQATLVDLLSLLSLKKADGSNSILILEEAKADFRKFQKEVTLEIDKETRARYTFTFMEWLNREGYSETVLEYLPDAGQVEDSRTFFARQVALIQTGRAMEARASTFKDNPLSPSRNLVLRALALLALGERDNARQSLSQAVGSVQIEEVGSMEDLLLQMRDYTLIVQLLEDQESRIGNSLYIRLKLISYYYYLGQEDKLQQVVQSLPLARLSPSIIDQINILYFTCLYKNDLPGVRRLAEDLASRYSSLFETRLFLGFCYAQSGDPKTALELIRGWENYHPGPNRNFAFMLAYILSSNGRYNEAGALIEGIPVRTLLDRERALLSSLVQDAA